MSCIQVISSKIPTSILKRTNEPFLTQRRKTERRVRFSEPEITVHGKRLNRSSAGHSEMRAVLLRASIKSRKVNERLVTDICLWDWSKWISQVQQHTYTPKWFTRIINYTCKWWQYIFMFNVLAVSSLCTFMFVFVGMFYIF